MKKLYEVIDTLAGIGLIFNDLEGENAVAVDLEADSMYHFKEKVCLVQLATKKTNAVVDPLKIADLSLLKPMFANPEIKKVFHGADYDIRSLYRDFDIEVNNLFDTQLACLFLGYRETGLDSVLEKFFDIILDKKYQKKDWSKRPLPVEMMDYAAADVSYLLPLASLLEKKLLEMGRLDWVREECKILSGVRPPSNHDGPLYLKFKGSGKLAPRNLAVLENLLKFRYKVAEEKDKPFFKILGNQTIMKLAVRRPINLRQLEKMGELSKGQFSMYGKKLIETIRNAMELPDDDLPVYPRNKAPSMPADIPEKVKTLKSWRQKMAISLELDPGVLCNNALLLSIALEKPCEVENLNRIKSMKNWQKKEFGEEIVSIARGMD